LLRWVLLRVGAAELPRVAGRLSGPIAGRLWRAVHLASRVRGRFGREGFLWRWLFGRGRSIGRNEVDGRPGGQRRRCPGERRLDGRGRFEVGFLRPGPAELPAQGVVTLAHGTRLLPVESDDVAVWLDSSINHAAAPPTDHPGVVGCWGPSANPFNIDHGNRRWVSASRSTADVHGKGPRCAVRLVEQRTVAR
jgi:hypothetical protein